MIRTFVLSFKCTVICVPPGSRSENLPPYGVGVTSRALLRQTLKSFNLNVDLNQETKHPVRTNIIKRNCWAHGISRTGYIYIKAFQMFKTIKGQIQFNSLKPSIYVGQFLMVKETYHNTRDTMRVYIYIYIPLMICGGSTMQ